MVGPKLIECRRFSDERGSTQDITNFSSALLGENEFNADQVVIANSTQHVLRGLHVQIRSPQKKVLSLLSGEILDVVVNVDKTSESFGEKYYFHLKANEPKLLFVPKLHLHGYQVISKSATLCYLISGQYDPVDATTVDPFDTELQIVWPNSKDAILSSKDRAGVAFKCIQKLLY